MLANFPTIVVVVLGGLATAIPLANPSVASSREYRSIAARQGAEGGNNKGLFAAKRTHRCYSNDDPKHPEPCHGKGGQIEAGMEVTESTDGSCS